jgi:hypothetical protein
VLEVQRGNATGEGAFQILAHQRSLARITALDFRRATAAELAHLLRSPHLTALERLSFGPCGLGDDVARLLAEAPALATLRALDFGRPGGEDDWEPSNSVTAAGAAALAASPHLAGLRSLGLAGNFAFGDAGLAALLAGPALRGLTSLDLRWAGLTAEGARALASSPWSASLRTLRLDVECSRSLPASASLASLHKLEVHGMTGADDDRALGERFGAVLVLRRPLC